MANEEHKQEIHWNGANSGADTQVFCSCGAKWTIPGDRDIHHIDSIFESHKRYFNKPATKVD
jgi:hypothetical protein